jgi:hypothetical protein
MAAGSQPRVSRVLKWTLPDGGMVAMELHRRSVAEWRADPVYRDGMWHAVPDGTGHLLLARLRHTPGGFGVRG